MPNQITINDIEDFLNRLTQNKDWLYIIQPCGIGDYLYSGGLSYAVQQRKGKSATVMIVKDRMRNLGITWDNVAQTIFLPNNTMEILRQHYFYITQRYEGDNYIYGHLKSVNDKFIFDRELNAINCYNKNVFNLPLDTPIAPPRFDIVSSENITDLHKKYTLDKNRTVILLPYANSQNYIDLSFWARMTQELKSRNYVVYTNVDGIREIPIEGTEPITTTFAELHYLADKVKCFAGFRSGIFDFLAMTNAKTLNITPFGDSSGDLNILQPTCNNRTFYSAVEYLQPMREYFSKDFGVKADIRLSHKHISPFDIYYSYEDIFNAMLRLIIQS